METAPPPVPSAAASSSKRYDRQLRVWGPQGQEALGRSAVAVLGSGPAAAEALKNLVLGGVGSFVVVDDAVVSLERVEGEKRKREGERRKAFVFFRCLAIDLRKDRRRSLTQNLDL